MDKVYIDFSELTSKTKNFVTKFLDNQNNGIEQGYMSAEYKEMIAALSKLTIESLNLPPGGLTKMFECKAIKICPVIRIQ